MNWTKIFKSFFDLRKSEIDKILDAQGCREGWIQGEMFLHAPSGSLKTNATLKKYDLVSEIHPMLAEIKICGGDYQGKMRHLIEADVDKLHKAPRGPAKYIILLIDTRNLGSPLGKWLLDFQLAAEEFDEVHGQNFKARIWKIKDA
jgi:hypothetical protein